MDALCYAIPARFAYMTIPADDLRVFADGMFPSFAKCPAADFIQGAAHRYIGGHDLLLDIPKTLVNRGPFAALHHAGHVVLTDLPTRAGIPIPGFSHLGLGHWLESLGIAKGWMSINLSDAGLGVIAVADGHHDLLAALAGTLHMNTDAFFHSFGMGTTEIVMACMWKNPILLTGGIEKLLAGVVSAWKTFAVPVDPLTFFGHAITSAILGFAVTSCFVNGSIPQSMLNGFRSGIVGGLFAVSPAFGFAAAGCMVTFGLAQLLAKHHATDYNRAFAVDRTTVLLLFQEVPVTGPSDTWFADVFRSNDFMGCAEIPEDRSLNPGLSYGLLPEEPSQLETAYAIFETRPGPIFSESLQPSRFEINPPNSGFRTESVVF